MALARAALRSLALRAPRQALKVPSAASAKTSFHTTAAAAVSVGGIGDWFGAMSGKLASKVTEKKDNMEKDAAAKQFKKMTEIFLSRENFDMEDMRVTMQDMLDESGAKGWRGKLGGEEQRQQIKVFQRQIDILDAMTEDERAQPRLLRRREKLRISQETGETVEYVNIVINSFDHFLLMHAWLRDRDERGLPIPESMELCQEEMQKDPSAIPKPLLHRQAMTVQLKNHKAKMKAWRIRRGEFW